MISGNVHLHEIVKIVTGLAPINPSTSTPDYVCMKGYNKLCVVVTIDAGVSTAGAITLKQASDVAGTGEKPLAFTKNWQNIDTAAGDALTETAVTSNTFTPDGTDNKNMVYVMEVDETDLDMDNGFDCVRAGTADATAMVTCVMYYLYPARYAATAGPVPSAIID